MSPTIASRLKSTFFNTLCAVAVTLPGTSGARLIAGHGGEAH